MVEYIIRNTLDNKITVYTPEITLSMDLNQPLKKIDRERRQS